MSKYDDYGELYVQKDVVLKPQYLEFLKEVPGLGIHYVDYQDPKTLRLINDKISNFTGHKINQIVSKLDSDLKQVLSKIKFMITFCLDFLW
jgi:serine protease inhibitor